MNYTESGMSVLVYEPDLIFSSRLERLSRSIEQDFRVFDDLALLLNEARRAKPLAFIINLDEMKHDAIQEFVSFHVPVLGYYSHVNFETARMALRSGVNQVVTRGAFVARAEAVFRELLDSTR